MLFYYACYYYYYVLGLVNRLWHLNNWIAPLSHRDQYNTIMYTCDDRAHGLDHQAIYMWKNSFTSCVTSHCLNQKQQGSLFSYSPLLISFQSLNSCQHFGNQGTKKDKNTQTINSLSFIETEKLFNYEEFNLVENNKNKTNIHCLLLRHCQKRFTGSQQSASENNADALHADHTFNLAIRTNKL